MNETITYCMTVLIALIHTSENGGSISCSVLRHDVKLLPEHHAEHSGQGPEQHRHA